MTNYELFSDNANRKRSLGDARRRRYLRRSESLRRRCLLVHVPALASGAFDAHFAKVEIDEHVRRRLHPRPHLLHASLFDRRVLLRPQDNSGRYSNLIRLSNAVKFRTCIL